MAFFYFPRQTLDGNVLFQAVECDRCKMSIFTGDDYVVTGSEGGSRSSDAGSGGN